MGLRPRVTCGYNLLSRSVVDHGCDYHPVESFVVHLSIVGFVGPFVA
jgi:hypothetical protein